MSAFDRRTILKMGAAAIAGTALGPGITLYRAFAEGGAGAAHGGKRWGMVIDANKCTSACAECTTACRKENNVPMFGDPRHDGHWIRKATVTPNNGGRPFSLPLLCNHCEHPPCEHVCPVAATFTRHDGVVLIDKHRCIGCRYCMIACPYKARTFVFRETEGWTNPDVPKRSHGVVEKCTFCVHRLDKDETPACVASCNATGEGAMIFGDLNDPESEIVRYIRANAPKGVREDLGLEPKVLYKGI